jgi:hypothetical protein
MVVRLMHRIPRESLRARLSLSLLLIFSLFFPAAAATAAVPSPASGAIGSAHGEFTTTGARFWSWALAQPAATNPLTDTTGKFCDEGQRGGTWFLAGTLDNAPVTRTCTVPASKELVFPVVNNGYFAFFNDPPDQRTEAFVRDQVAFVKDGATNMRVTIDGMQLSKSQIRFEESRLFSVTLPADNLFGQPEGFLLDPCVDAGYYVHLDALRSGKHTIHIQGALPNLTVDVTYKITSKHS